MKLISPQERQNIQLIEERYKKSDIPKINVGDTVILGVIIQEGSKERIQVCEGVVISKRGKGPNTTITLRKILQGVGVERVYFLHSPKISYIRVNRRAKVRRAKLYYLRNRSIKGMKLKLRPQIGNG